MLCLSVWFLLDLPSSWADISSGRAWLAAQSQPNGRYATTRDLATPVQASAEALRTFQTLGETTLPGILAARAYLAAEPFHTTEYLARKILMQAEAGASVTTLVTALRTHQNADGGFGDLPGYASTTLDTAFALEALAAAGDRSAATTGAAVSFLRQRQAASGG